MIPLSSLPLEITLSVYQLRNYSQHCENVVHSVGGNQYDVGVKPTSDSAKLLSDFKDWKDPEKQFICQRSAIDLLETFKKTYDALSYVHTPVIQYMLDHDNVSADIAYLRKWADWLIQMSRPAKNENRVSR